MLSLDCQQVLSLYSHGHCLELSLLDFVWNYLCIFSNVRRYVSYHAHTDTHTPLASVATSLCEGMMLPAGQNISLPLPFNSLQTPHSSQALRPVLFIYFYIGGKFHRYRYKPICPNKAISGTDNRRPMYRSLANPLFTHQYLCV